MNILLYYGWGYDYIKLIEIAQTSDRDRMG